jgi:hypothetical protein
MLMPGRCRIPSKRYAKRRWRIIENTIPNLAQADILKTGFGKHGVLELLVRDLQAIVLSNPAWRRELTKKILSDGKVR